MTKVMHRQDAGGCEQMPDAVAGMKALGMVGGSGPLPAPRDRVMILAHDPAVIAANQAAAQEVRGSPATILESGAEALLRPGQGPRHRFRKPESDTDLIMVAARPADTARLADALRCAHSVRPGLAALAPGAAALLAGLSNGEIAVRYQPVVRLADRRPLMVEALARWQRPHAPVSPEAFVPLAERSGLVRALSVLVASTAAVEIAPLRQSLGLRVSVNLPLALLLQPDLPTWLGRALRGSGMRPRQMSIELTETTEVRDLPGLRRALLRLRDAGHPVLLDDLMLRDGRARLLELPFAGCKLDRSLVEALPDSGQARREARRLVRLAERRGQTVIAEGIADQRLWALARGLGVHAAQGFGVGRPMPAAELPRWAAWWRSRHVI